MPFLKKWRVLTVSSCLSPLVELLLHLRWYEIESEWRWLLLAAVAAIKGSSHRSFRCCLGMEEGRTLDSREQQQPRMLARFPPGGRRHHHEQQQQHHQQADSIINLRTWQIPKQSYKEKKRKSWRLGKDRERSRSDREHTEREGEREKKSGGRMRFLAMAVLYFFCVLLTK